MLFSPVDYLSGVARVVQPVYITQPVEIWPGLNGNKELIRNNEGSLVSFISETNRTEVSQGGRVLKSIITNSLFVAIAAVLFMPLAAQTANAQEEGKSAGLVAVLDVAKVFKEHGDFNSKMEAIKSEADGLKVQIQQQQEGIKAEAQGLAQYDIGSPERNQLEATLEQKQASLRTKARQAEADLLNREAKIYFETYQRMQSVVSSIANKHGISLVLRFDSETIESTNRAEVIKGVNRSVVYHRRLDLTNMVIREMNPSQAQASSGTQIK